MPRGSSWDPGSSNQRTRSAVPGRSSKRPPTFRIPLELRLLGTPDGPRLAFAPVKELQLLRAESRKLGPLQLKAADAPITDLCATGSHPGDWLDRANCVLNPAINKRDPAGMRHRDSSLRPPAPMQMMNRSSPSISSPLRSKRKPQTPAAMRNSRKTKSRSSTVKRRSPSPARLS